MRRIARAVALAFLAAFLLPALVAAHPLGNFTINHYAGLRIEPDRVLLDVVIDQAEIPAFQARQALDTNEDGEVSDAEIEAGRVASCTALAEDLHLAAGGDRIQPTLMAAGLELRPGVGGLSTLRQVCTFEAQLPGEIGAGTEVAFVDRSYAGRIGWREIVVEGSGVAVTPVEGELREATVSDRLQAYPPDRLDDALADERIVVSVAAGGAELPAPAIPDATPVHGAAAAPDPEPAAPVSAAVPGGVAGEIPALFQTADLTPFVVLLSLATAAALGAAHALTPGHGKTLMAAYLVGTRGTPVHAIGLGLSVSMSHTIGILALASLVIGAQGILNPDVVVRAAPVVAALAIVAIGGWMLISELRRRTTKPDSAHSHNHHDDHGRAHTHEHSHGGMGHSHAPGTSTITWRSLFILGLAGGLIPSTSALLILLGAIGSGRPAFGIVLVGAFGIGMALVMTVIGLLVVGARRRLDQLGSGGTFAAARSWLPLGAASLVLGLGVYLTAQAIGASPTL